MSNFIFPQSQKQAQETAGQILTYGFAREVLGMCLNTLHAYYVKIDQIEMIEGEATRQGLKTLDDTRIAIENLYAEIANAPYDGFPTEKERQRINGYLYLSGYTCRVTDKLVGEGWAADLIDTVGYAWSKTFGSVIDRAADTLDAVSKIPQLSLNSLGDITKSLGWFGYVAMALILALGVGIAASLWKGKVPK